MTTTVSTLDAAWHELLLAEPARTAELAHELNRRMSTQPWRHPHAPVPVRPLLMRADQAASMGIAGREVVRLAAQECLRRSSSPAHLAELLGVPVSPLLTGRESWNRWALSQARPDMVFTGGVPKVLECNISSAIGGPEQTGRMDPIHWSRPETQRLARTGRMWSGNSIEARRELLVRIARHRGVSRPRIAITGWSERHFFEVLTDAARHGLPCTFEELEDLTDSDGLRNAGGQRIDVLLTTFITAGAFRDGEPMDALVSATRSDSTMITSPEVASLYSSKQVLAWLTESAPELSAADRTIIDQHVPWTAVLRDGPVRRGDAVVGLVDLLEREQYRFLIKPADGYAGAGVVMGAEVSAAQWRAAVESHFDSGFVVQEFCAPDLAPVSVHDLESGETDVVEAPHVISPILVDGTTTGFFARYRQDDVSAVTSASSGSLNTVFVHE